MELRNDLVLRPSKHIMEIGWAGHKLKCTFPELVDYRYLNFVGLKVINRLLVKLKNENRQKSSRFSPEVSTSVENELLYLLAPITKYNPVRGCLFWVN
jgi:hypothetical protein